MTGGTAKDTRVLFVAHRTGRTTAAERKNNGTTELHGRFGEGIEVVDFATLTAGLLHDFRPHFVVSPIVTPSFDVLDLARLLCQLRYSGAYRVLTEGRLPDPDLVLREVRSQCPGIDVDVLDISMLRR